MKKIYMPIIVLFMIFFINTSIEMANGYISFSSCLEFNGKGNYVGKIIGVTQESSFTVEGLLYIKGDSLIGATGYGTLLGSNGRNRLLVNTKNGHALAQMGTGDHWSGISPGTNKWVHYAYVYDNMKKEARWFIDGKEGNSFAGEIILQDFYLGYYGLDHYFFNGYMKEVRLWNTTRSQREIINNMYNTLSGNEEGLVGYWPIDESSGVTIFDKSLNNNNAEIKGAKWSTIKDVDQEDYISVNQLRFKPYQINKLEYRELPYTRDTNTTSRLSGYAIDEKGIILWKNQRNNTYHYHPVFIAQRCLSWIDDYYRTKKDEYIEKAIQHAEKLIELAFERNEPFYLPAYYFPYTFDFPLHGIKEETMKEPWYSGMAQGQVLSVFSRLYYFTQEEKWLSAADKVFNTFMLLPNNELPWTVYIDNEGSFWISEYPLCENEPTAALNGFIFAIYGLYDYYLFTENIEAKKLFLASCTTVEHYLDSYRNEGDISFYCLKHLIKSSSYHRIHINQLKMLYKITGNDYFNKMSILFEEDFS